MAVNEYFFAHFVKTAHVLANDKNCFIVGAGQVLPKPVECCYSNGLEVLWIVRKSDSVVDAISAECMLTWLLQIYNDSNLDPSQQTKVRMHACRYIKKLRMLYLLEHLLNDIVLLHQTGARSLRANNFTLDQV